MDVLQTIFLALLIGAASSLDEPATPATTGTTSSTTISSTETNPAASRLNCTTTWRLPGNCVLRLTCDNNTPAIDLTPYAPRGPKKVCPKGEVCCPLDLIVTPSPPTPQAETPEPIAFDDD